MEAAKEQGSTVNATAAEIEIEATEQVSAEAQDGAAQEVSVPVDEGIKSPRRFNDATPSPTVYIGNLFFDITAEDLKVRMESFGVVEKATIISDARGLSKGLVGYSESAFWVPALY